MSHILIVEDDTDIIFRNTVASLPSLHISIDHHKTQKLVRFLLFYKESLPVLCHLPRSMTPSPHFSGHLPYRIFEQVCQDRQLTLASLENLPRTKLTDTELGKLRPWNEEVIANCSGTI